MFVFGATFSNISMGAAQDIVEPVAPSNSRVHVRAITFGQRPGVVQVTHSQRPTPSRADKSSIPIGVPALGGSSIEKLSGGPDLIAGVRDRGPLLRGKSATASTDLLNERFTTPRASP